MRQVGWLIAILFSVGWVAGEIPSPRPHDSQTQQLPWRLTRHGWEPAELVVRSAPHQPSGPHPACVGLLQMLVSVTGLVAFSKKTSEVGET